MQSWIQSHVINLCSTCPAPMINLRGKISTCPFLLGHLIQLPLYPIHDIALWLQQRVVFCVLQVHSSFGWDSTIWWQNMNRCISLLALNLPRSPLHEHIRLFENCPIISAFISKQWIPWEVGVCKHGYIPSLELRAVRCYRISTTLSI